MKINRGDKVTHPKHPGKIGVVSDTWVDGSIEAIFDGQPYGLLAGSFTILRAAVEPVKKSPARVQYSAKSGRSQPFPQPTRSPDGQYRIWDRPRAYVAEVLNMDPDIKDRITNKEKTILEPERSDLLEWAREFLRMFPAFKQLVLDLLDASGNKISIQFPWEVCRWFSLMSDDQFERLIPIIREHRKRVAEYEIGKQ